jgi:hypothetical protein
MHELYTCKKKFSQLGIYLFQLFYLLSQLLLFQVTYYRTHEVSKNTDKGLKNINYTSHPTTPNSIINDKRQTPRITAAWLQLGERDE